MWRFDQMQELVNLLKIGFFTVLGTFVQSVHDELILSALFNFLNSFNSLH